MADLRTIDEELVIRTQVNSASLTGALIPALVAGLLVTAPITEFAGGFASALIQDSITNGITDKAPSQNAVFDALALKADAAAVTTALGLKADASAVATALALKADITSLSAYLTTAAAASTYLTSASAASTYLTQLTAATTYQPLDSDLTTIAALTTTSYGRAFLVMADQAALRTAAGYSGSSGVVYSAGVFSADTGTSGHKLPWLDGANIWGGVNSFTGAASTAGYIRIFNNGATTNQLQLGQGLSTGTDNVGYLWNIANAKLSFGTNNAERLSIAAGGDITTTGALGIGGVGSYPLDVFTGNGRMQSRPYSTTANWLVSANTANNAFYPLYIDGTSIGFNISSAGVVNFGGAGTFAGQVTVNELVTINRAAVPLLLNNSGGGSQTVLFYQGANLRGSLGADVTNALYVFDASSNTRLSLAAAGKLTNYGVIEANATSGAVGFVSNGPASGTNAGSNFAVHNAGSTILALGNYSSIIGGGYNAKPTLYTVGGFCWFGFGAGTLVSDASGNISVSSDERLKIMRRQFKRGLADMMKMDAPRFYKWRKEANMDDGEYVGFGAQGARKGIPEAVGKDTRGYLTLQDRPILATHHNAIIELNAELKKLRAELNELRKAA